MKRLLAIGAVSVIGALSIASAAALTVNGGAVQAGSDVSLECDTDGVDLAYAVSFTGAPAEYKITSVTVSGIDTTPLTGCVGRALDIQLTDGGVAIAGASGTATIGGTGSETILLGTPASAELTDDVHVAIH